MIWHCCQIGYPPNLLMVKVNGMSKDNITGPDLMERLVFENLKEQRRKRRWGIFFKVLTFAYLFALLAFFYQGFDGDSASGVELPQRSAPHVALIDLKGVVSPEGDIVADQVAQSLRSAFDNSATQAVVIRLNSPGGSPVQAGYIYDEITRLKALHPETPVYAVASDVCASACYYIAAAADEIYANKASIVGSIGVLMSSFGFVDSLKSLGAERRLLTAGEHKAMLDPFLPVDDEETQLVQNMLDTIHQQFIQVVKDGRGARLADDDKIFSGLFWTGEQAMALGLVDGLGSAGHVARELIGVDNVIDYTTKDEFWQRFAKEFGASMAQGISLQQWQDWLTPSLN